MQPWQHELSQCIRTIDELENRFRIKDRDTLRKAIKNMRMAITPHTMKLIDFANPRDPLLLMNVPQQNELQTCQEELEDPIGDEAKSPIPFLTHRYHDRVLIYTTFSCFSYCRFCFRRLKTGQATPGPLSTDWDRMIEYLRDHSEVDEVILTGGDPFILMNEQLAEILERLRSVSSIIRIRFHTRSVVNLPSRITPSLVDVMKRYSDATHPIYIVTHFNHPREIVDENVAAVTKLVDAGIVVRNQSVLLRGVNDDVVTLRDLFKKLVNIRIVPYYLHQLDLAKGTNHFRVPIERGLELMRELRCEMTGIAFPHYVLDVPGGKGKVPLCHRYQRRKSGGSYEIETIDGDGVEYQEPDVMNN